MALISNLRCALPALLAGAALAYCQPPVIAPGGIVNSATYSAGGFTGNGVAPGSTVALFGANLATDTWVPDPLLLTTQLGGTTVTVGGIPAYLTYADPGQLVFLMPWSVSGPTTVTVSTAAGTSPPYSIDAVDSFGVFTRGIQGCGAAAALGPAFVVSPSDSLSPGDVLSVYGTGLFPIAPVPPDGMPAPSAPLGVYTGAPGSTVFDVDGPSTVNAFAGVAAGWIGLNQINVRVPDNAREGCAVSLFISTGAGGNSNPVTVSIHRGGAACSDPPAAAYGRIEWVKTVATGFGPDTETDQATVSLQASPGKLKPADPLLATSDQPAILYSNFGRQCSVPGYRSLDAGLVTAQGGGFGSVEAATAEFGPPENGQIAGLVQYRAALPLGSIRAGSFGVAARGGSDVDAFQSNLRIGPDIHLVTKFPPGAILDRRQPVVLTWTGGDSSAWVTLKVVSHQGAYDRYAAISVPALEDAVTMTPDGLPPLPAGPVEIMLEVTPANPTPLVASGLSLGGVHTWKYLYRITALNPN